MTSVKPYKPVFPHPHNRWSVDWERNSSREGAETRAKLLYFLAPGMNEKELSDFNSLPLNLIQSLYSDQIAWRSNNGSRITSLLDNAFANFMQSTEYRGQINYKNGFLGHNRSLFMDSICYAILSLDETKSHSFWPTIFVKQRNPLGERVNFAESIRRKVHATANETFSNSEHKLSSLTEEEKDNLNILTRYLAAHTLALFCEDRVDAAGSPFRSKHFDYLTTLIPSFQFSESVAS